MTQAATARPDAAPVSADLPLTIADVRAAADRIAGAVVRTPTMHSQTLSNIVGTDIWLKFENLQFTAAYKERGALNALLLLTDEQRSRGVIAASAGNHAQGLSYHGTRLGVHQQKRVECAALLVGGGELLVLELEPDLGAGDLRQRDRMQRRRAHHRAGDPLGRGAHVGDVEIRLQGSRPAHRRRAVTENSGQWKCLGRNDCFARRKAAVGRPCRTANASPSSASA